MRAWRKLIPGKAGGCSSIPNVQAVCDGITVLSSAQTCHLPVIPSPLRAKLWFTFSLSRAGVKHP